MSHSPQNHFFQLKRKARMASMRLRSVDSIVERERERTSHGWMDEMKPNYTANFCAHKIDTR